MYTDNFCNCCGLKWGPNKYYPHVRATLNVSSLQIRLWMAQPLELWLYACFQNFTYATLTNPVLKS